ncbi:MAG: hypothetical protein A2Y40_07660 [Candidatus Margulisbacteria bacterium GWF2_35_9]|nr:MAG: hypothetical protein A2Y40_07660 [Candidatus Margulisbacteria bacterium GWF2_35_9]
MFNTKNMFARLQEKKIINILLSINYSKLFTYLSFCIYLMFLISLLYLPKNQNLKIGMHSPKRIVTHKQYEIQTSFDKEISDKILKQKINDVKKVYTRDRSVEDSTEKLLLNFFVEIKEKRANRQSTLNILEKVPVKSKTIDFLLKQDEESIETIILISQQLIKNIYIEGILLSEDIVPYLQSKFKEVNLSSRYEQTIIDILSLTLKPNLVDDNETTKSKIDAIKASFIQQTTIIKKGQPIVYEGDVLTPLIMEILGEIGLYRKDINWKKVMPLFFGIIGLVLFLERMMTYYVRPDNKNLKLIFSIEFIYILNIYAVYLLDYYNILPKMIEPSYLILVSFFSFLFCLLVNEKLSLLFSYFNVILMIFLFNMTPMAILYVLIATMITNFFLHKFKTRRDLASIGFLIGVLTAILIAIFEIHLIPNTINPLLHMFEIFLISLISIIFAIGPLEVFEEIFDVTTDLKLLDYADLKFELMKKLLNESPGTYYHSLMVSNLAEAAAEKIGANGILARVASYYHDIGKLKKPEYFIENQSIDENPHDTTMPSLSALTILSHPKDGLEMARKYSLPKEIQDIILQHHGTSLLVYFYHKMLRMTVHDIVEESQFRYDCPKPRTKESAIIMLADSVEASIRSIEKPSPIKIRAMIEKIVNEKIDDEQLDESNLTFSNIEDIKDIFLSVITNQYHSRIKYPDSSDKSDEDKSS